MCPNDEKPSVQDVLVQTVVTPLEVILNIKMPASLYETIEQYALEEGRTLSEEIVYRLQNENIRTQDDHYPDSLDW